MVVSEGEASVGSRQFVTNVEDCWSGNIAALLAETTGQVAYNGCL